MVAEREGVRVGCVCRKTGAFEYCGDLGFGKGFGKDLPGGWRLDVDRGIVSDSFIHEQPAEEAAQGAEFACDGTGFDGMAAEVLHKCAHVCLGGGNQQAILRLDKLGELLDIAEVSLDGSGPQPSFDAQVGGVFAKHPHIALDVTHSLRLSVGRGLCQAA